MATRLRLLCHYGGKVIKKSHGTFVYAGGDLVCIEIKGDTTIARLKDDIVAACPVNIENMRLRHYPGRNDRKELKNMETDEDFQQLMHLYESELIAMLFVDRREDTEFHTTNRLAVAVPEAPSLRLCCHYGGRVIKKDDDTFVYAGGHLFGMDVNDDMTLAGLKANLAALSHVEIEKMRLLHYGLPSDKKQLVMMVTEADLKLLLETYANEVLAKVFVDSIDDRAFHETTRLVGEDYDDSSMSEAF